MTVLDNYFITEILLIELPKQFNWPTHHTMGENLNIFGTFLPGGAKGKCFNFREVTLHL